MDLKNFDFQKVENSESLLPWKKFWRETLSGPQDGMWESLTESAVHWSIAKDGSTIGYACVDGENRLLQFFLEPRWLPLGLSVLQQFIRQQGIKKGIIGTNNPICLSLVLQIQQKVEVHSYLFHDFLEIGEVRRPAGEVRLARGDDLEALIEFCHRSMGGPKFWLSGYLGDLINKGELFQFIENEEVIGTFEVRHSPSDTQLADLGIIVSPDHRRKGLGTFLLSNAKAMALEQGMIPICSCEKTNLGSLKAIQNNGFRVVYQMLEIWF